jgi:hypothetical protein
MDLDGIIYTPSTHVEFAGGTAADSSSIMIIADTVDFRSGSTTEVSQGHGNVCFRG